MGQKPIFVPPYLGEEIKSNAERKMFEILKALDLQNMYILHSLGLPKHQTKVYGEIDFIIVCSRGIACLEIKGGRVECRGGAWYFTDRYGNEARKNEGPFAQVTGNMFSLKNILKSKFKHNNHFSNMLIASGVVFPDIEFSSDGEEIIPEIIFDQKTEDISQYVNNIFNYWQDNQRTIPSILSLQDIKELVDYLRGDFLFRPALGNRLNDIDRNLMRYTEEQLQVIRGLFENQHLVIKGGAGTGKTLMAIDYALRESSDNKKVLYLTFNKHLANHLNNSIGKDENIKIVNIHALFGEYVNVDSQQVKNDIGNYFAEILPEQFYEYVKSLPSEKLEELEYDVLIMDEAQDILKANYLFALDYLLCGGLEKGKWAVFYDEKQNLFNPDFEEGMEILNSYNNTKYKLSINCRNTREIGEFNAKLSETALTEFLKENGEEVTVINYINEKSFENEIIKLIKELKKEKVRLEDVVFLSPKKYENSQLKNCLNKVCDINRLSETTEKQADQPQFATIQGFKGLDSKVVILVDMEKIYNYNFSRYVYTAISRARTKLYVMLDEKLYNEKILAK